MNRVARWGRAGKLATMGVVAFAVVAGLTGVAPPPAALADPLGCSAVWSASPIPWTDYNYVAGAISGTSPTDVWTAGADLTDPTSPPVLAHSDGTAWTQVALPVGGDGNLLGLATVAPDDVWIGGYLGTQAPPTQHAILLWWNGSSVQRVHDPIGDSSADSSSIVDVAASAPDNVWVIGRETSGGVTIPVAERWDGSSWTEHDPQVPAGASAEVRAVSTTGPDDVWAVGTRRNVHNAAATLAGHWNGSHWRVVRTPKLTGRTSVRFFADVAEGARGDVWAVGRSAHRTLIVDHWSGSAWVQMTPGLRLRYGRVPSVVANGPDDVWVEVGDVRLQPYGLLPYLHWDGSALTPTASPAYSGNKFAVGVGRPIGLAGPGELWSGPWTRLCPQVVGDGGFSPAVADATSYGTHFKHVHSARNVYPNTVAWKVDPSAGRPHEVKDASGLGLFDSGSIGPGGSFTFDIPAAGTYPVIDPTTGAAGSVASPVAVSPTKANASYGSVVGAGQQRRLPGGLVVQMEIRQPGSTEFVPWLGQREFLFTGADPEWIGPGTYEFRARVADPATGNATDWSPGTAVKSTCCHTPVELSGFAYRTSYAVGGTPTTWRVDDSSGRHHVVADASALHLFRSRPLANGQTFAFTYKGAGTYPVVDALQGFHQSVVIRPAVSAQFATVGQNVTVTAAVAPPFLARRVWQIEIKAPGDRAFRPWHTGRIAVFTPGRTGQFLFRARLWDTRYHVGVPWSQATPVVVSTP